jgi:hypothetical protein
MAHTWQHPHKIAGWEPFDYTQDKPALQKIRDAIGVSAQRSE